MSQLIAELFAEATATVTKADGTERVTEPTSIDTALCADQE